VFVRDALFLFEKDSWPGQILAVNAEIPDTEVVFREQFAGQTETPNLFPFRACGPSPGAEKFGWLEFFKAMCLVVWANSAVLPADLPVLFRILGNIPGRVYHKKVLYQEG
jgi:hypothetical protein